MEETRRQMAIHNRLYYLKNLQKEGWMESKIERNIKAYRQKAIKEYVEKQNIDINEIKNPKNYLTSSLNEILNNSMLVNIIIFLTFNIYVKSSFPIFYTFCYRWLVPQNEFTPCSGCCYIIPVLVWFMSCIIVFFLSSSL